MARVLGGAKPWWVLAVAVSSTFSLFVRAQRWRLILRPLGRVGLGPALSATAIGFGAGAVLPLRLGEFVRPALLARRNHLSFSAAVSSVVLERIFDMLLVLGCFLVVGLAYPVPEYLRRGARVLAAGGVVGVAVLVVMLRNRGRTEELVEQLLPASIVRVVGPLLHGFLDGLAGLADAGTVVTVLLYSAYLWGVITLGYVFAILALGMDVPLVAGSLTSMVTVAAFVFLPQGPGFVGTWQAGCVLALGLFGVAKDVAVGYSLLTWVGMMGSNLLLGALFLAREDLSVGDLLRTGRGEPVAVRPET